MLFLLGQLYPLTGGLSGKLTKYVSRADFTPAIVSLSLMFPGTALNSAREDDVNPLNMSVLTPFSRAFPNGRSAVGPRLRDIRKFISPWLGINPFHIFHMVKILNLSLRLCRDHRPNHFSRPQ